MSSRAEVRCAGEVEIRNQSEEAMKEGESSSRGRKTSFFRDTSAAWQADHTSAVNPQLHPLSIALQSLHSDATVASAHLHSLAPLDIRSYRTAQMGGVCDPATTRSGTSSCHLGAVHAEDTPNCSPLSANSKRLNVELLSCLGPF